MGIYSINGKPVEGESAELLEKILGEKKLLPLHDGNNDINGDEAIALMGNFCHNSEDARPLTPKESAHLAELFTQSFPQQFNKKICSSLFATPIYQPSRAMEVIDLVAGQGELTTMKMDQEVYEQLRTSFTHDHEVGFVLFADSRTGMICKAIPIKQGVKRSIFFNPAVLNAMKMTMHQSGFVLVGVYHSHTFTQEEAQSWAQVRNYELPYDESLLSRTDGHRHDGVEEMDQFILVGSDAEGKDFKVRAFLGLYPRAIERLGVDENRIDAKRFIEHYHPRVGNENHYELDIEIVD